MSPLTPGPGPEDWRIDRANEERADIEKAVEQRAIRDQAKGVAYVSRKRRGADRVRRMLARGASPAASAEADVSDEQAWERERQRRNEYEQDRLDGRD